MPNTKSSSPLVRYGFIGCGMMGQEHLRNIELLNTDLPQVAVVAIFEPDAAMRQVASGFATGAVFEPTLDAVLARQDIDAWVITSPNFLHANQLQLIAAKNPKPILVEKPACTNLEDVAKLQALASNYPCPIWTAMEYRYMPPIAAFIDAAHAKSETGEPVMFSIREHRYPFLTKVGDWNRFNKNTGGTLVEKCCHFFDLMRHVMQADPVRVYASGAQSANHLEESYGGATPDILDNAYVVLDFPPVPGSNIARRAMLDLCMFAEGSRYQEELVVVGERGKLNCQVPGPHRFWPKELGDAPVAQLTVSKRVITGPEGWTNSPQITPVAPRTLDIPVDPALLVAGDHNGSTFYQHQKFLDVVRSGKGAHVEVSLTDGLKAVVIGLAAEHSAKTGQAVDLSTGLYAL